MVKKILLKEEVFNMVEFVVLCVLVGAACTLYENGKRLGSKKGYHVGRQHGRRRR